MNTTVRIKASQIYKDWHVIDAAGRPLGRVATEAAILLRGKHKPTYEPHLDDGDFVIVINASQVRVTGRKAAQIKYYTHSGYPGGLKTRSYEDQLAQYPERVLEKAIWGMLPGGPLGKAMFRHLKVYKNANHPHQSQLAGSAKAQEARPAVTAPGPVKPARLRPLSVPQVLPEPVARVAPAPRPVTAAKPRLKAKPAPKAKLVSKAKPLSKTEPDPKAGPVPKAEAASTAKVAPTAEVASTPKVAPKAEAAPRAKPDPKAGPVPTAKPASTSRVASKAVAASKTEEPASTPKVAPKAEAAPKAKTRTADKVGVPAPDEDTLAPESLQAERPAVGAVAERKPRAPRKKAVESTSETPPAEAKPARPRAAKIKE